MKDSKEAQKLNQIKDSFCGTFCCSKTSCKNCMFGELFWYRHRFGDLLRIPRKGDKNEK